MCTLKIYLFGKLQVQLGDRVLDTLNTRKVQELFVYLLLHGQRLHCREVLAALLWDKSTTTQSLKYLRQTLWQLQTALDSNPATDQAGLLLIDSEWIGLNSQADVWLDTAAFEKAFACVQGLRRGRALDPECVQALQNAVEFYRGDLLEGWYQDWCLYERERLQNLYLAMLDNLMDYCESQHDYQTGVNYGLRILRHDQARERTHRQLMRLYYLADDRTAALRQYECCVAALNEELGVEPAQSTVTLYNQIRAGGLDESPLSQTHLNQTVDALLPEILDRLKQLQTTVVALQDQVKQDIQALQQTLNYRR